MSEHELSAEDAKLATLARGARGRVGAVAGAAVRDETGRTYSAAAVNLPSLQISALALAVAQAVAAGARGAEAAVVVGESVTPNDVDVLRDLAGAGVPLWQCATDGSVRGAVTT
jgi:cytidine deaminase